MRKFIKNHKIWSAVIVLVVLALGYYLYRVRFPAVTAPEYTLARARIGSITDTVTGTGQVAATNQLDVKSQVSGEINTVNVSVGQHVRAGELLATIDATQAANSLANARLSLAKLTEPAKATDISNAENSLAKSYADAYNAVSSTFLDMPAIMTGLNTLMYGSGTLLSEQESIKLIAPAQDLRIKTGQSLDRTAAEYTAISEEYKATTRDSSPAAIAKLLDDTHRLSSDLAGVLQNAHNTVAYIEVHQPDYMASARATAMTNVNTWSSTMNTDSSSLLSSEDTIQSNVNSITNLESGADQLDVQAQRLSVAQQEQNYANYFIRAPFDGVVGRISVNHYDQASAGTVIATVVGDQKVATISLNEVDAAKVSVGEPVNITFDAIDGLNATGTVSEADLVGTVTQGVVTYNVKITVNTQDARIRPGMSINASIITKQKPNVLVVPSSAVKTQGRMSYVQVIDMPFGSSTTTRMRGTGMSTPMNTVTGRVPRNITVTTGESDDTNTEIISGLSGGEWIVTRTITAAGSSTAAPTLLNSLGGNRAGGGGGVGGGGGAFRGATGR